jgi:hypothetical protein
MRLDACYAQGWQGLEADATDGSAAGTRVPPALRKKPVNSVIIPEQTCAKCASSGRKLPNAIKAAGGGRLRLPAGRTPIKEDTLCAG